jgi:hypothetical protein
MKTSILLLSFALATGALAQSQPPTPAPTSQPPPPPPSTPPIGQPMEPPAATPNPPPAAAPGAPPPSSAAAGEWVYTTQYRWVWMPYDQQYTHVVEDSGVAYEFVYYPGFGWRWVVAPWVLSIGPRPYFVHGPVHFAWYARPWFRPHPLVHRDFHDVHEPREHRR